MYILMRLLKNDMIGDLALYVGCKDIRNMYDILNTNIYLNYFNSQAAT